MWGLMVPQEDLHYKATLVGTVQLLNNTIGDESSISTNYLIQWSFYNNTALDCYTRQVLLSHCQCDSTAPHCSACWARDETNYGGTIFTPNNGAEQAPCDELRNIHWASEFDRRVDRCYQILWKRTTDYWFFRTAADRHRKTDDCKELHDTPRTVFVCKMLALGPGCSCTCIGQVPRVGLLMTSLRFCARVFEIKQALIMRTEL